MTPRQLIEQARTRFENSPLYFGHGTANARDEAEFMVLHTLNMPFDCDDSALGQSLTAAQVAAVNAVIEERVRSRRPAAYILGEAWFAGLPFYVDENVLVPRSPFAELILEQFSPWCDAGITRILDIGTGSGCIAIACAVAFPGARVDAVDISTAALRVAAKNVERHNLGQRIELIESDLFQYLPGRQYNLIIANPPYVDATDMQSLPEEYRHEPALGLQAGDDGLDCVRRILHDAPAHLVENGILAVEVGNSQHALMEQYPEIPFLWLEFAHGGEGVFLLTREELQQWFK